MNGREVERLLSLLDVDDDVLSYVREHKEEILQALRENGMATIPVADGEPIVLRPAVAA